MSLYSSPQAALDDLESVINTLTEELQLYAQRPQPNGAYLDKQNRHIHRLTDIYNGITALQHYDAWTALETLMKRLQQTDPNISGYYIHLRTQPQGNNFALIEYNPFCGW